MARPNVFHNPATNSALPDAKAFQQARRRADSERRKARMSGRSADLLCYEQVRDMLKASTTGHKVRRQIPLDAIVGSVGRCADYTRSFRPLTDSARHRWIGIQTALAESKPLPPINVVQLGEVYFVSDGHHRVSVARDQGMSSIEALIVQVEARVRLSADIQSDELALQAQYASFLESTRFDEIRPGADLSVTVLDEYQALLEEIEELHHYIRTHQNPDATLADAAGQWYDEVYLPAARVVRSQRLLQQFQGRTEADLVLWLQEYRAQLQEALGWEIELELAAADLVRQHRTANRALTQAAVSLTDRLGLDGLQAGPSPGTWREMRGIRGQEPCLFRRILVPFTGVDEDWPAVAQAAEIACQENAQLLGLHVIPGNAYRDSRQIASVQDQFHRQCRMAGVSGAISVDQGHVARRICDRSPWADLIVLRPDHAPPEATSARLRCGLHSLIRRSPTPLLIVPGAFSGLERPLLAYDGSPRAREALFFAAYLASHRQADLAVAVVAERDLDASRLLEDAATYLQLSGVEATMIQQEGPAADALLQAADAHESDLIVMGGYGHNPIKELLSGSMVDHVLRTSKQPVLVCR